LQNRYLPAQPASPGHFQTVDVLTGMRVMGECTPGDYCNLARASGDDLLCPNSTACANASVMEPAICDHALQLGGNISYCPAGTWLLLLLLLLMMLLLLLLFLLLFPWFSIHERSWNNNKSNACCSDA
jgi:hypothetical protein